MMQVSFPSWGAQPADWNGDYIHQFNGGIDGIIVPATGPINIARPKDSALSRGFAVVSSDAGHNLDAHPELGAEGPTQFGHDARARANYGHAAVARLDPVARQLVTQAYGAPIRHAYGVGRSNGGRHALVAAARMPGAFDGLLVGYPGFNLPKAAIQHAWDAQTLHGLSKDIRQALSQTDLDRLSQRVLSDCDDLDGLADGMIFDWRQCQSRFDPGAATCADDAKDRCISAEKMAAMQRIMGGPKDSAGRPLYSDWLWDSGINSANWRAWKLEGEDARTEHMPRIVAMGAASLAQVFSTPPAPLGPRTGDLLDYLLRYDFDHDPALLDATDADFPESGKSAMIPPGLDGDGFEAFRNAGGKMLIFHGQSDPVFSAKDTVEWFHDLPHRGEFARLYLVPGMPHGHSPDAPDDVDLLTPLVEWVESGRAPEGVIAATLPAPDSGKEPRRRPLCPYPSFARFMGGDAALAENFTCQSKDKE